MVGTRSLSSGRAFARTRWLLPSLRFFATTSFCGYGSPARAEPVIGPRFARSRWLGRDDRVWRQRPTDATQHRACAAGAVVEQPARERGGRQRRRVQKSLEDVAAELGEQLPLSLGLDAFGDDREVQALADAHDGGDERPRRRLALDVAHEALVDLDLADRQKRKPAEAR